MLEEQRPAITMKVVILVYQMKGIRDGLKKKDVSLFTRKLWESTQHLKTVNILLCEKNLITLTNSYNCVLKTMFDMRVFYKRQTSGPKFVISIV